MRAVWALCRASLYRKKLQNGLIALLILLAALLLGTSATVLSNTDNLFNDVHKRTNGAHQILTITKGLHDPQQLYQWWNGQEGVAASEPVPFRYLSGVSYKGEELPNLYVMMMDTPAQPPSVDRLLFADGAGEEAPRPGTAWIPTSLAYTQGIKAGDMLSFKTGNGVFELQVSAVVIDLPYGAPFATTSRIWMNHNDYMQIMEGQEGSDNYILGLRFQDYERQGEYWASFEGHFGMPYLEERVEFEEISAFYLILNRIIGFVMVGLGIVMMLIGLFTIGYTISDAILSNYRTIGVLKSTGLSSARIVGAYALQYAILATAAIIPGLVISRFASALILNNSLSVLKTSESNAAALQEGGWLAIAAGLFLLLLVIGCVLSFSGKIKSVQPAQAIRYGMSEAQSGRMARCLGVGITFGRWPIKAVIAFKHIVKNGKSSVLIAALAAVTTAVLVFSCVLLNSIISIQQTAAQWGYDSADISVSFYNKEAYSSDDFETFVRGDARVKDAGWLTLLNGVLPSEKGASGAASISLGVLDGSYDKLGFTVLEGSNPVHRNEMAIGINVASKFGKEVGDTMDVYIEGRKHTMLVSGIYQAIANMSNSARIMADALNASDETGKHDADVAFINLHDYRIAEQVVTELNGKYPQSVTAATQQTLLDSVFTEASAVLIVPLGMLALLFVGVTFMIIYSVCRIAVWKESGTYGIYKSLGMTNASIRGAITLGVAILTLIGAGLGIVIGIFGMPGLLKSLLLDYGIAKLPLILPPIGIAVASVVSAAAASFGAWHASRWLTRTSPRILIIE
ncbi:ABC transporter permease [Paenibacillus gorillae]|uniref:ABC transporter permease n=1 Tax=Paenibacillus gorillae TaxID=1243662 RepID=UPI0004B6565A|nr:FtsX-like permease family protein [Paenibacillus gorillae]